MAAWGYRKRRLWINAAVRPNSMFWAIPAMVLGTDLPGFCASGEYIDSFIKAGGAPRAATANSVSGVAYSVPLDDQVKVTQ